MVKIIKKCDICGKDISDINTLVLFKKKIDYCKNPKCIRKAMKIKTAMERELDYQKHMLCIAMKSKENNLIKTILKK